MIDKVGGIHFAVCAVTQQSTIVGISLATHVMCLTNFLRSSGAPREMKENFVEEKIFIKSPDAGT